MSARPITPATFYVTGGTMRPDALSYIERDADEELYRLVKEGEYCYVLTPRQMGKSSLMARMSARLRSEGVRTAILDVTDMGGTEAEPFYRTIAQRAHEQIEPDFDFNAWWQERQGLTALARLTDYFAEVVKRSSQPVVIFLDEIDSTPRAVSDDLFAGIRALFNRRATDPPVRQLTFVLLGVASPAQLIRDAKRTPFNIGHGIELSDFTPAQAQEKLGSLLPPGALERVLYWTDGHPYLTQIVCRAVSQGKDADAAVEELLLSPKAQREETNLKTTGERLKQGGPGLLRLYLRVLRGEKIEDQPANPLFSGLKLTGVVKVDESGCLRVRNRVYERVFSEEWVKPQLKRPLWQSAVAGVVVLAALGLGGAAWKARLDADRLASAAADQIALQATLDGNRDGALLAALESAYRQDTNSRRRRVADLAYPAGLLMSYLNESPVYAVAFSPDGKTILTGNEDNTARLWHVDTGQPLGAFLRHEQYVSAVAFSPDGKTILTGSSDKTARLWRADTGQPLGLPVRHESSVDAVAFSPDGKTILTGSRDKTAQLWRADTGQPLGAPLRHQDEVWAVAFSPDGKTILTGSFDTARLWHVDTGQPLGAPLRHENRVRAVAFSPDGKTILTGSNDNTARLWHAHNGQPLGAPLRHESYVSAVAFSPDGKTVLTGCVDNTARLWRADTGQPFGAPLRHQNWVRAVAFSPDGKTILTGDEDKTARLWRADTGQPFGAPLRHQNWVRAVAFSPDGKTILTGSGDKTAQLWRADTGQPFGAPLRHQNWVRAVAFSPDGKTILTGSSDKTAQLWRADTGQPFGAPLRHENSVTTVAFSPDGKTILTGSSDKTARLWRADTGQPLGARLRHESSVDAVAFSPDGKTILTGSSDKTAQLWRADTGQPFGAPLRHQDEVWAVAFSPDGKTILTGSSDKTAQLWRADTGQPLGAPLRHENSVTTVAFSPDGKTILTSTINGWTYSYRFDGSAAQVNSIRLTGDRIRALHFPPDCKDCYEAVTLPWWNRYLIQRFQFDLSDVVPVQGNLGRLKDEWQRKLALRMTPDGKFEPLYPLPKQ